VVLHETYAALKQLRREGKTRFIGMSCYPLGLLKQAIERCDLDVVISYAHCNLFNTRLLTELMPGAGAGGGRDERQPARDGTAHQPGSTAVVPRSARGRRSVPQGR